jgi:hypothetical protein
LFDLTSVGTRIVIGPNQVDPISISHPLLERLQRDGAMATSLEGVELARAVATRAIEEAKPAAERSERAAAAARQAEAAKDRAVERFSAAAARAQAQKGAPGRARAEARLLKQSADVSTATAAAEAATKLAQSAQAELIGAESRAREARQRAWPISIMVSLKTQRIYVRQGFEPVLEMPAVIKDPQKPIGTYVFYATEVAQGNRGWLGVALREGPDGTARKALDRIELPQQVTEMLTASAWLGSALIVSDEAPYKETTAGTDFIVVLSDEPQGALKIRSPEQPGVVAQSPGARPESIRAYRNAEPDYHFRHPLGFFP